MSKVWIICDRCKKSVEGLLTASFTAGFYNVSQPISFGSWLSEGGAWRNFGNEGEEYICDHCMWSDPRYQEIYQNDGEMQQWLAGSE